MMEFHFHFKHFLIFLKQYPFNFVSKLSPNVYVYDPFPAGNIIPSFNIILILFFIFNALTVNDC